MHQSRYALIPCLLLSLAACDAYDPTSESALAKVVTS